MTDASDPRSIDCSPKIHQIWSLWKSGCQRDIVKEVKREEKAEVYQITQDWTENKLYRVMNLNLIHWPSNNCRQARVKLGVGEL